MIIKEFKYINKTFTPRRMSVHQSSSHFIHRSVINILLTTHTAPRCTRHGNIGISLPEKQCSSHPPDGYRPRDIGQKSYWWKKAHVRFSLTLLRLNLVFNDEYILEKIKKSRRNDHQDPSPAELSRMSSQNVIYNLFATTSKIERIAIYVCWANRAFRGFHYQAPLSAKRQCPNRHQPPLLYILKENPGISNWPTILRGESEHSLKLRDYCLLLVILGIDIIHKFPRCNVFHIAGKIKDVEVSIFMCRRLSVGTTGMCMNCCCCQASNMWWPDVWNKCWKKWNQLLGKLEAEWLFWMPAALSLIRKDPCWLQWAMEVMIIQ